MGKQFKEIQSVMSKGKSSSKLHQTADELDYLVTFNQSITQAMDHTVQDLSDGVFINVANLTLARRDSYLEFLKAGIKQDTLISLRTAPIHMSALFPDHIISKGEREYGTMKTNILLVPHTRNFNATTLIVRLPDSSKTLTGSLVHLHGSKLEGVDRGLTETRPPLKLGNRQSHRSSINDNYCVGCVAGKSVCVHVTCKGTCSVKCVTGNRLCLCDRKEGQFSYRVGWNEGLLCDWQERDSKNFHCKFFHAVDHVHFANGHPQKERCKSQLLFSRDKACERCFLCRSLEFCKKCHKCPRCFSRSACRSQITPVLEKNVLP